MIFDEATSALDSITEEMIIGNIFQEFPDKTIIIISHRPAPLKMCGKVVKIEGGKVI
ncbi:MAG: hypothetical protein V1860_03560 [bacterium]